MADSSAIRAGRAFVEIFADSTKLEAALKNIEKKFTALGSMIAGWGKGLMAAGVAVLTPLIGLAKVTGEMGETFNNMSKRTGVSVEALSELAYAASQSGTDIESLENGIKRMQRSLEAAASGEKNSVEALQALGLSVQQLAGMTPDRQFRAFADAIAAVQSPAERTALAMEIFGKHGTSLIPILSQGSIAIDALMKRARELGLTMSTTDAQAAEAFNDKLSELWQVVKKAGFDIGSVLLPPLTSFVNLTEKIIVNSVRWLKENKELVVMTLAVGAALVAAGATLYVFGTALVWAVGVLSAIGTAIATAWAAIAAVGGAVATVLTSPVLGAVAAVAVLGATITWASGAGGKALDWLGERFSELKNFATEAFHGIADALMAGDIELAAKILWTSLKIVWQTGVDALGKIWEGIKLAFLKVFYGTVDGARAAWEIFTDFLKSTWIDVTAFLKTTWINFQSWYQQAVEGLSNILADADIDRQVAMGQITKEEGEKRKQYIDNQTGENVNQIQDDAAKEKKQIQTETAASHAAEDKKSADALASIGDDYNRAVEKARSEHDKKIADSQAELNKLHEQFNDLVAKAHKEREDGMNTKPPPGAGVPPGDPLNAIGSVEKSVFGTFSASAARISSGGSPMERVAKATEETAKNTKKVYDILKPGQPGLGL
jgi:hypothetical protein